MGLTSEQELIERARNEDEAAWADLFELYSKRLSRSVVGLCRRPDDAEDVVQDTFVIALTKLKQFRGESAFFTWLYQVAKNVALTHLRRRDNGMHQLAGDVEHRRLSPADAVELKLDFRACLQGLDPARRSMIILKHEFEFSYDELAKWFDVTRDFVKNNLYRGRQELKSCLEGKKHGAND